MTSLVPSGRPSGGGGGPGAATPRAWTRWPSWTGTAAIAAIIWTSLQFFPKAHPLVLLHSRGDYERVLRKLSGGGDPDGRGDPLSDRALFADWLLEPEGTTGVLLTVGGAIAYERPKVREQQAAYAAELRRREAYAQEQAAELERRNRADAEQKRLENEAIERRYAATQAQAAVAAAAQAKTVACNTARAHAYGASASVAAFLAWVRAHPCPEGTDIGDGYWNVAH